MTNVPKRFNVDYDQRLLLSVSLPDIDELNDVKKKTGSGLTFECFLILLTKLPVHCLINSVNLFEENSESRWVNWSKGEIGRSFSERLY